jgi:hypothetical protein
MLHRLRRYTREQRLKPLQRIHEGRFRYRHASSISAARSSSGRIGGLGTQPLLNVTLVNNHDRDKQYANEPIKLPNIRRLNADVLTLSAADFADTT